jgi:3-hydroxyisobutyrate dehydrogenase-like beta-hydroxyacid dehydrogenase
MVDGREYEHVGFVGLGMIGLPMAVRLAGHRVPLTVHNRTAAKMQAAVAAGAHPAATVADVVRRSDIVLSCLAGPAADQAVFLGAGGLFSVDIVGKLFVNTSTIGPELAVRLAAAAAERGAGYLDCPLMSNGPASAVEGTLVVPVGGGRTEFERALALLELLASTIEHVGAAGTGQIVKLANNMQLAVSAVSIAQAVRFAVRSGVDADALGRLLPLGSGRSYAMQRYLPDMIAACYRPEGNLATLAKDVALAVRHGASVGESATVAAAASKVFRAAVDAGLAGQDVPAVIEALGPFRGERIAR